MAVSVQTEFTRKPVLLLRFLVVLNVFSVAQSVCPAGWAQRENRCYYIFQTQLNKADAATLCDDHAAQLVSFASEDEWKYISSLMTVAQLGSGAWTALTGDSGKWTWPDSNFIELHHWRNAQTGSQGINYVPQPDSLHSQAKVIIVSSKMFLVVELASTQLYPFCVRTVDTRDLCDSNEDWTNLLHVCHKVYPPATWPDAISTCSNLGGEVYSPGGPEELIPADALLTDPNENIWLGASYKNSGYYYEADNRPASFLPWLNPYSNYSVYSNKTCIAAQRTGGDLGFYMDFCDKEKAYICRRPVGTCPLGWYQDGTQCFRLHIRPEERVTWFTALDYCKSQNAEMAQDLSKDADAVLFSLLAENDVLLAWLGFSGGDGQFHDLDGTKVFGNYYLFPTTTSSGGPSSCGVTDFDPRRIGLSMASYCYSRQPFVCTIALADTPNTTVAPSPQCDQDWTLFYEHCYQIVLTPMTQDSAVANCQSLGASILMVNSSTDQSVFSTPAFMDYGMGQFWIGVRYNSSTNYFVFPATGEKTNFYNLDPMYHSSDGACVYVSSGSNSPFMGSWFSDHCNNTHSSVCRKPATPGTQQPATPPTLWPSQCGVGWTYSDVTNLCYFVSPYVRKPWREAREDCQSLHGELLSIDGEEEQLAIENLLRSDFYSSLEESMWIGASDMTAYNGWAWSDDRPFHFLHWAEGEPAYASDDGDNCGYIPVTKFFEWETRSCGDKLGFICRKSASGGEPGQTTTTAHPSSCTPQMLISGQHSILFPQDFSASSSKDANHTPDRCRLTFSNKDSWRPANDSVNEWLAVAFHSPVSISSLQLQGEKNIGFVSKFKLQYQYDDFSPWYWYTDPSRAVMIFEGVTVPDEATTIILSGDIRAHAIKLWPVEWGFGIAVQMELWGCPEEDCQADYAISGPLFVDDGSITASTELPGFESWNARIKPAKLNQHLTAWMPSSTDQSPWIEVDLGENRIIEAIAMAGDGRGNAVIQFQLMLSRSPGDEFIAYQEPYGTTHTFSSATAIGQTTILYLQFSVEARLVRVVPLTWQGQCALKFDLQVCSTGCTANAMLAGLPSSQLTASDSQPYHTPDRSKLDTPRVGDEADAWTPLQTNAVDVSYIQADLGTVMQIKAVATQGSESEGSWVTIYYLAFSYDGYTFTTSGATLNNEPVAYKGNFDGTTVVKAELSQPVNARYVQLRPHEFSGAISVRWEIYACSKHTASSPLGCYADDETDPDLPYVYQQDNMAVLWPEACLSICYDKGYRYAGLQNGYLCSCGNSYGMYGPATDCSLACQYPYLNFTCGGLSKNTIYSTGISANDYVCPTGWTSFRDSCYSLLYPSTWTYSLIACHRVMAYPVDISDMAENDLVASMIADGSLTENSPVNTGTDAWIGLSDLNSNLDFGWNSGADVNFTNWGRHQPTVNPGLQQHGVIMSSDGSWRNVFVDENHSIICEKAKQPSSDPNNDNQNIGCPPQWVADELKCYRFFRQKSTWSDAQSFCVAQNSSLARADGRTESIALATTLSQLDGSYWMDVHDALFTGLYTHSAGRADVTFANWAAQKPDSGGKCVSLQTGRYSGEWMNEECDNSNRFVCEQRRPGTFPPHVVAPDTDHPCPPGWEPHGTLCYQFNIVGASSLLTWHEANENCVQQGASLASFHNDTEYNNVVNKFGQSTDNFWIGLNNLDSFTGFKWSDESVMNFVRWGDGQPRSPQSLSSCGEVLLDTKTMGLQVCGERRNWMCSVLRGQPVNNITQPVIPTPDKYGACSPLSESWNKYKDYCYYTNSGDGDTSDAMTWRESRQWCQNQGGELASVTSAEENAFIYGQLNQGIPVEAAWIGLNELDRDNGYSWSDGTPIGTWQMNWNVNEPDDYNGFEGCVEMLARNGRWNDDQCSTRQGFVCKQPAPGVNITKPPGVKPRAGNCPPGFNRLGYKCYSLMGVHGDLDKQSWADARASCRYTTNPVNKNYTLDIASITSLEENAFITTLLAEYKLAAWVGLRRVSSGSFLWADNEDVGFEGWSRDEPNMPPGNDSCVFVYGSSSLVGKWSDVPCEEKHAYICQGFVDPAFPEIRIPPTAQCNVTGGFQQFGTSCYKVVNQTVSWREAQANCVQSQASLASIMDGFDWAELYLLSHNYSDGVWIGLNDLASAGLYEWVSGFQVEYTRWGRHQPRDNGGCVYLDGNGLFNNDQCSNLRAYVCRSDIKPPQPAPDVVDGFCSTDDFFLFCSTCYFLVPGAQLTYAMAGRECELRGATLASISAISPTFDIDDSQRVWVGLRDSADEGFSWDDSSVLDFTNWAPGKPVWSGPDSEEVGCVVMLSDSSWVNVDCDDKNGYLCAMPATPYATDSTLAPTTGAQSPAASVSSMCSPGTGSSVSPHSVPTVPSHSVPTAPTHSVPPFSQPSAPTATFSTHTEVTGNNPHRNTTLSSQHNATGGLTAGDKAGIVIGVLAAILVCFIAVIVVHRREELKSSFLRREASRVKNFENSLYAETRKDTLTKSDHIDGVNIVQLETDPRKLSVSYSVLHASAESKHSATHSSRAGRHAVGHIAELENTGDDDSYENWTSGAHGSDVVEDSMPYDPEEPGPSLAPDSSRLNFSLAHDSDEFTYSLAHRIDDLSFPGPQNPDELDDSNA